MLHTVIVTTEHKIITDVSLSRLSEPTVKWFWVDFDAPSDEEACLLRDHFHFHPLAIEDCFQYLQRPKVDYYEGYNFLVLQTLRSETFEAEEIDLFVGPNFLVTFHLHPSREIDTVRQRKISTEHELDLGPTYITYLIMDKIVDDYFPPIYQIEDKLNQMENIESHRDFITEIFDLRDQLLSMRRIIYPMRELLYRILTSDQMMIAREEKHYFKDIDDHLLKLSEMVESNREVTADLRDSYISINSNRMNSIMTTLTIIASIFIPLTFIVGVYGMNFEYMPELTWRWGYLAIWLIMLAIGIGMLIGFKLKGWFK